MTGADGQLGPVTVQLDCDSRPATFTRLSDALSAARHGLALLSVSSIERRWLQALLESPTAEALASENLRRYGIWVLSYRIGNVEHELTVRPASVVTVESGAGGERVGPTEARVGASELR
ncbi:hypothetical protein [Kitasatospora viridis]|uniref:Uncharacterized protein n=1 Tax=Kitasatospora viridis TaxID=281105 RepID=A0A561UL02_9ACTN|nr:hypothetical protein [Kitasatospora viridis]TWG00049.1 hypothetical protein FHX73_113915 [Kitasatospora viridis]